MMPGQSVVFLASILIFLLVVELVRKHRLSEGLSLFWLVFAVLAMAGSTFAFAHMVQIASLVGIVYPPSAMFLFAILFLLVFTLYLSTAISRLSEEAKTLAQELALLRLQLNEAARKPTDPAAARP